jgi:hypothetical protein
LCNGESFEFLVYDSGTKSSGIVSGVLDLSEVPEMFLPSLKSSKLYFFYYTSQFRILGLPKLTIRIAIVAERIFDYFLMAYTNALRAFGDRSLKKASQSKHKRQSTDGWIDALAKAECARYICREGATLARGLKYTEAEEYAAKGIRELKERLVVTAFNRGLVTDSYLAWQKYHGQ